MNGIEPYLPYIVMAVNGLIAGWLASLLLGGGGLIRNLFVGILGAFLGGFLVNMGLINLDTGYPLLNQIIVSTAGAILIIILARIIGRS